MGEKTLWLVICPRLVVVRVWLLVDCSNFVDKFNFTFTNFAMEDLRKQLDSNSLEILEGK